jgi:hypothetical protein
VRGSARRDSARKLRPLHGTEVEVERASYGFA